MTDFDVIIIGAGAAGLMCAMTAAQRGRRVLVLDHANKPGKKILISGGGRCNFTHLFAAPENYISANPHFCKSALSRYTPYDFLALVDKYHIPYHEKSPGQLFCDRSAKDILNLLLAECEDAGAHIRMRTSVQQITQQAPFQLETSQGTLRCQSLVIATGGLSFPTMGASGFGYDIARQYNLKVLPRQAALVPFTLPPKLMRSLSELSGIAVDCRVECNGQAFRDNLLITHRGLSGPAMLQISSYWQPGDSLEIDLLPDLDAAEWLLEKQKSRPKAELKTLLAEHLSKRLAQCLCELWGGSRPINQYSGKELRALAERFQRWRITPAGTEGYRTAEVTLGGIDTHALSSKTMECRTVKGLYFIGEVVDVTGQLGGYNFQWAWASGHCAGQYV